MVTEQAVLDALRGVKDPEQQQDIVALGLIRDLTIAESEVAFTLAFTTQSPASKATMHSMASRAVGRVPGVSKVQVKMGGMPGSRGRPGMFENRIIPVEVHGLKMMSIGLLVNDREPLVWRGPMIHSFIQQMLKDVMWGALDYLVFDMPPGTGDAQLSLSQILPLSGVVMVTTPQNVALLDVRKALGMFQRLNVPILGVVENMSGFTCPHCGEHTPIFGDAGGARISEEYGVPLLSRIPLEPETRIAGDQGTPITLRSPDSAQARAFGDLARAV